jgi:hypothetical protein
VTAPRPRLPGPFPALLALTLAIAASLAFLALAVTRRLNFDESLALRAGTLELARADAAPAFLMPWTLALGALARLVPEPGALFLVARVATAGGLLALVVVAARACGLAGTRLALALALTLVQRSFVSHGLEFRYDAALLGGLLTIAIAVADPLRARPALAGVAVALVGLHHLKGALVALAVGVWVWVRLRGAPSGRRRFVAALGLALAGWLALVAATGLGGRWLESLSEWFALALGARRVPLAEALGSTMLGDLAWWSGIAAGLVAAALALRRGEVGAGESTGLVLGCGALALVVVHPHPWSYMLALPAPFLAVVLAHRLPRRSEPRRLAAWAGLLALALAFQVAVAGRSPVAAWREALAASREPEVEALRRLRAAARPGEAVLDPSGLAYFLSPCSREWYTDTLYADRPGWMSELSGGVPNRCVWVVHTYRLSVLPQAAQTELGERFELSGSGLALRRGDARLERLAAPITGFPGWIQNYP